MEMSKRDASLIATLQAAGMLTEEQRAQVEETLANSRKTICAVLAEMEIISSEESKEVLELLYNAPFVRLSSYMLNPDAIRLVPERLARQHTAIPVDIEGRVLTVAMADPADVVALDDLKAISNCEIAPLVAQESDIIEAVARTSSLPGTGS
jgi:type IV pilus assembly protein PilB